MKATYFLSGFIFSLVSFIPVQAQDKVKDNDISLWIGTYSGEFPCNTCKNKKYRLTLLPDNSYQEEIILVDSTVKQVFNYGKYNISRANVLKLSPKTKHEPIKLFIKHPKGLIPFESNEIVNERYALTKQNHVSTPVRYAFNKQKMCEGVLFYASGVKPSWQLDIRSDQTMLLKINEEQIPIPEIQQPIEIDENIVEYKILTGEREININIQQGFVKTKGNQKTLQAKVVIDTRKNLELNFTHLEGFGSYVPDSTLQHKWIVKSMYQNPFTGANPPIVEFHLNEGNITGNVGCDSFSGIADYCGNRITTGLLINNLTPTCPEDIDNELTVWEVLNGKTFTYRFQNGNLILMENKIRVMELKMLTIE